MEYCGMEIDKDNLPRNWWTQAVEIIKLLWQRKIEHNNIEPRHILVKHSRLYLIDFALSKPLCWKRSTNKKAQIARSFDPNQALISIIKKISRSTLVSSNRKIVRFMLLIQLPEPLNL